jgi:hypothetical protein
VASFGAQCSDVLGMKKRSYWWGWTRRGVVVLMGPLYWPEPGRGGDRGVTGGGSVELQVVTVSALIPHRGGGETKGWSKEGEWTHWGGTAATDGIGGSDDSMTKGGRQ